jgi:hypothetical protein
MTTVTKTVVSICEQVTTARSALFTFSAFQFTIAIAWTVLVTYSYRKLGQKASLPLWYTFIGIPIALGVAHILYAIVYGYCTEAQIERETSFTVFFTLSMGVTHASVHGLIFKLS